MELMVILLLTVALAAGVVWWVTVGGPPLFFVGRRNGGSTTARNFATRTESAVTEPASGSPDPSRDLAAVPAAAARWPRPVLDPIQAPSSERGEQRRRSPVRHRSSRSTFTYAQPVEDPRPPFVLTLLRLVFGIALVAGLITLGIWSLGRFAFSVITRFFE